jgi:hypothetical protein
MPIYRPRECAAGLRRTTSRELKVHEQIDDAIRLHDRLLLILSEHSMSSEWVKTELAKARKREVKEGKRVLFPVRLVGFERLSEWECFDGDTGKIRRERYASTSSRTSASGKNMIRTRRRFGGW